MNCYLVRENDGLTVIDTAMGAARIIAEAAKHLGQPVRRILLTHSHVDHVGSVDALKKIVPDARVIAGQRDSQLLVQAANGVKPSQMELLPGEPQTPVKGSFKKLRNLPDLLVNENDKVGSLRVISTPGHTPGHLAFLDERDGTLFAGDSLVTFGGIHLPFDTPWFFPFPKWATWHNPTALTSARRLFTLEMTRILAGHGPAVEAAHAPLEQAIGRAANLLA